MSSEPHPRSTSRPVLLLGIDGLARAFLEAPAVATAMPNLGSFLRSSEQGSLASTFPAYTGPAWTTITTGVDPGRHGIFGFTDRSGRPVSDAGVAAARIWDYVGAAGGRSVVVNVPITYPPRPIEGVLVSGMPVPTGAGFTWPPHLSGQLQDRGYVVDVAVQEGAQESTATFDRLAEMTRARGRLVRELAARERWDLFAVVFVLPDRLGHPWWKHLVPGHDLYYTRAAERSRAAARASLVALDDAIGDLLAAVPAGTAVVLCSDHGFGPLRADVFFDLVLASEGLIEAPSLAERLMASVGRHRLARRAPQALHRWARARASGENAGRRPVWTAPPYESAVRVADPGDRALVERVTALLLALEDPEGRPLVEAVSERTQTYRGPRVDDAPELLCRMADESVGLHDGLHARRPWVSRDRVAWGTHETQGVIALSGTSGARLGGAQAADVAPTVLALAGMQVRGLDGQSLVDAATTTTLDAAAPPDGASAEADVYSAAQEDAVLEHLKGLGYVD